MNRDYVLLNHIQDEINFLEELFSKNGQKDLMNGLVLSKATLRSLEIILWAANSLSKNFKANNPQIEWKEIAGMRDRLIHRYFTIDWDIVYEVITDRLPELKVTVLKALE